MTGRHSDDALTLAEARPEDADELVAFHNREFAAHRRREFWRWEYLEHLPGQSVYVVARDRGRVVATQGMIPLRVRQDGRVWLTGKSENSLVAPELRGRGLWQRLYRRALDICSRRGMSAVWGFTPVPAARRGLAALGFSSADVLVEAVAFTRLAPAVANILRSTRPWITKLAALAAAPACWLMHRLAMLVPPVGVGEFEIVSQPKSGDDLSRLAARIEQNWPGIVRLELDQDYVDWRVNRHPHFHYRLRLMYDRQGPAGIALLNLDRPGRAAVVHLEAVSPAALRWLLGRAVAECPPQTGTITVAANRANSMGSEILRAAQTLGFVLRPHQASFVLRQEQFLAAPEQWALSLLWFEGYAV